MAKEKIKTEKVEKTANARQDAKAIARYLRVSPRKIRLVIDAVRNKPVHQAFATLAVLKQKSARLTEKLLKSAVANAKNLGLDETRLYISKVFADGGPTFKRFMSRSQGRADRILKRTAHLTLQVSEREKPFKGAQSLLSEQKESQPKAKKQAKKALAGKA